MKYRNDFVTNSSSSSFIVSSKENLQIPDMYSHVLKQIKTPSDVICCLEDIVEPWCDYLGNNEKLKEKYHFTDDQIIVLKAIALNEFSLFDKIIAELDSGNYMYYLLADRDWLFDQERLLDLLRSCDIIDQNSDL